MNGNVERPSERAYEMNEGEIFEVLLQRLNEYRRSQNEGSMLEYHAPLELEKRLCLHNDDTIGNWQRLFDWVDKYLRYSVKTNHKGFVNRMWVGGNLPSTIGEMVAAVANTSSCTYESAPVATVMEKYMLQKMLELVGFKHGEGQMTTGSSNANMIAMMAARNSAFPEVKESGLFGYQKMYAFVSADAHYSLDKAANILGLGEQHLVIIPVNEQGEMEMELLENHIQEVIASGGVPLFVVGTAGTTVRGAYDNIEHLVRLRDRYNFWLHIDGAWGGAVVLSETLRQKYLGGIEKVDSFTWDFHKMLGTSLMCNVFLINNKPHVLGKVCSCGDESYIFHDGPSNEVKDLGAVSLQCGRRVDSLKWFLDWKFYGQAEFARRLEYSLELCRYAEEWIQASENLEMAAPRTSFNVCFVYSCDEQVYNDLNLAIRSELHQSGKMLIGYAYMGPKVMLRLLLANSDLTKTDIDDLFILLVETGNNMLKEP